MDKWLEQVPGAGALEAWFGYWPDFHDAEVVSLDVDRAGTSVLRIHATEFQDRFDWHGYYPQEKHAIVSFSMRDIVGLQLPEFSEKKVLSDLHIVQSQDGFEIDLEPTAGHAGSITAKQLSIQLEPLRGPVN